MNKFSTEIVKTKTYNKTFIIVFSIFYVMAGLYSFLLISDYPNVILKYASAAILVVGIYYMFGQSFLKPKSVGTFEIFNDAIHLKFDKTHETIPFNQLEEIILKYTGYGSWCNHSIYGNKNFLQITDKMDHTHQIEILLKNRSAKNILKSIMTAERLSEKFYQ
ncbi:hypothetical protein [uncultured Gelidibacter sp.]|uniref:hypothetical protein n=1 Tax=uncultured Gelidibacter sp. TaxID=259318 RepID=UPI00260BABC9|nr:hypothetical protein [uncultured Gelidibacter sp.]